MMTSGDDDNAETHLAALSGAFTKCKEGTRLALTSLARLASTDDAPAYLKDDIKEFARLKNASLDQLGDEVAVLREGFSALVSTSTNTTGNGGVPVSSGTEHQMQILPEPLEVEDIFDEHILAFLPISDVSRNIAYVCQRWFKAARSEKVWRQAIKRDMMDTVAPLCHDGILGTGGMSFLQFAERRFKADAIIRKWQGPKMMDDPAAMKLLAYKPDEIHIASWLYKNDKVDCNSSDLSMLCRGIVIPEFFERYAAVALAEYDRRDVDGEEEYGDDPVMLPEIPVGLSAMAVEYHTRARNVVARIYLRHNGELLKYQPRFSYSNRFSLYLASSGQLLNKSEVISALSYYDRYYENEQW